MATVDRGMVCCSSCCQTTLEINFNVHAFKKRSVERSVLGETACVVSKSGFSVLHEGPVCRSCVFSCPGIQYYSNWCWEQARSMTWIYFKKSCFTIWITSAEALLGNPVGFTSLQSIVCVGTLYWFWQWWLHYKMLKWAGASCWLCESWRSILSFLLSQGIWGVTFIPAFLAFHISSVLEAYCACTE